MMQIRVLYAADAAKELLPLVHVALESKYMVCLLLLFRLPISAYPEHTNT